MKRRHFLSASASAALVASLQGCSDYSIPEAHRSKGITVGADGKRRIPWQNWSGYQHCLPDARVAPRNEDELASLLKASKGTVRPVGAGHSFTPLIPTDGTIVSLRNFNGLLSYDSDKLTATFGAGTKIGLVGEPLHAIGQALQNMPDIDEQSLAGAIGTATHGTGAQLGGLHSFVSAMKIMTPQGELIECSETKNHDIFKAAQVSLGSLGIITELTFKNAPTTRMKHISWVEPMDQMLERFDEYAAENHSFEFYYIPFLDYALGITINPTDEPFKAYYAEGDNEAAMQLMQLRDTLGWAPGIRRWLLNMVMKDFPEEESVDVWYKAFPSERAVRFNEMEYHMDREHLLPTLKKVRERIESQHNEVFFPVEVRVVKGDDAWLSPFYGHESSGSIAIHRYYQENPAPYFNNMEPLYQDIQARPHWGKMHSLKAADFAARYPKWKDFLAVREALDPSGKMLNEHLREVFGV